MFGDRSGIIVANAAFIACLISGLGGCKSFAPIHVWAPPTLESAVAKRVVVAGVDGPKGIAEQLESQLIAQAPLEQGRETYLAKTSQLRGSDLIDAQSVIKLASATEPLPGDQTAGQEESNEEQTRKQLPSDIALAHLAKENQYDYLLRGEVIQRSHGDDLSAENPRLTVSWRLSDVRNQQSPIGSPISVDLQSALIRYPDLQFVSDPKQALVTAAARETCRLIVPSIVREDVRLAKVYGLPGSRDVRKGVRHAAAGRWDEAERIWKDVADRHPMQYAARINLAIAAAAEQDFSKAKQLARAAIRSAPSKLAQETLVWIETKQRAYHKAFGLPDPPEGWYVTSR